MLIKKELESIPVQQYPKLDKESNEVYAASVDIKKLNRSGKILVIDIFRTSTSELQLRFFSDGISFLICQKWPAKEWLKRHPQNYLGYSNISSTEADRKKAHSFFKESMATCYYSYSIKADIEEFATEINAKKSRQAYDRKYALMKDHFNMFPEYPKDLSEYCETNIFGFTYIFVSKIIKNKRTAICGHCGHVYEVDKADKPGGNGTCTKCGMSGIYKGNWTNAQYENKAYICIAHKVDGQLLLRWTNVKRTFNENKYKYDFEDNYKNLYLVTEKGNIIYSYRYQAIMQWGMDWYRRNNGDVFYGKSYVYTNNLREVFGETYYHVDLQNGMKNIGELSFANLLDNLKNIPAAEYLFKMGMPALASGIAKDDVGNKIGFTGVLGVSKQYLPLYKKYNVNLLEHRIIKSSKTWVNEICFEKLRNLKPEYWDLKDIENILETMSFEQFINYFAKQKDLLHEKSFYYILTLYKDYISMSQSFNVDMSIKAVKFPKNIKKSHDLICARYNEIKCKAEDENFKQAVDKLYAGMTEYAKGEYCIVFPTTRSEFITEGQSLNHCVGNDSYYRNHIAGTQMIFFIRKVEDPEKPFFTMEIDMKTLYIRQLYGFGDCSAPPEVRKFANDFLKKLKPNYEERKAS